MHPILTHQNDPEKIRLLKASTVAYTRAKTWEGFITYFLIFLAVAYPLTYIFLKSEQVKLSLFACSKKREAICSQLDEMLRQKTEIPISVLRDIQDEIYLTRQEATKVPNFYFRMFQQKLERSANQYIAGINELY